MGAFHRLPIREVRPEAEEAVRIELAVPPHLRDAFRYAPGQHLTLRTRWEGEELLRCYSVASGVDEDALRLGVKRVAGGRVSGWLQQRRAGETLEVLPPAGRFTVALDPAARHRYVALAAGSGITPVLSLFRSVLACEPRSAFTLLYGNRRLSSIMFLEELAALKDRYLDRARVHHVLSRERRGVELFSGRLDRDLCARLPALLGPLGRVDAFFVCGPATMIEEVTATLAELGVDPARVRAERFHNPGQRAPAADAPPDPPRREAARVRLRWRGVERLVELPASAPSVLEGVLAAGVDLPFSCKAGVCCTCRARLLEGEVQLRRSFSLEPWEIEAGYILTCQARPKSAELLLDLDTT
ncbi:MAG: 2Fe-2S iron-sulfur cluster-binding protein [Sandaracinaceae bacterium]